MAAVSGMNPGDPRVTLSELVDLALCSPEIGAVNFNILRILLHETLGQLGLHDHPAHLDDLQANQITNFKNYIQGAGTASPMPGVLRYAPGRNPAIDPSKTPRTGRVDDQKSTGQTGTSAPTSARKAADSEVEETIDKKVARLERQVQALYTLPTNTNQLPKPNTAAPATKPQQEEPQGISGSDMWQIVQLNNRVAAAEAAIQKMASLIEDLAKQIKILKGDHNTLRKDGQRLSQTNIDMNAQMEPCLKKCEVATEELGKLKTEVSKIQEYLPEFRRQVEADRIEVSKRLVQHEQRLEVRDKRQDTQRLESDQRSKAQQQHQGPNTGQGMAGQQGPISTKAPPTDQQPQNVTTAAENSKQQVTKIQNERSSQSREQADKNEKSKGTVPPAQNPSPMKSPATHPSQPITNDKAQNLSQQKGPPLQTQGDAHLVQQVHTPPPANQIIQLHQAPLGIPLGPSQPSQPNPTQQISPQPQNYAPQPQNYAPQPQNYPPQPQNYPPQPQQGYLPSQQTQGLQPQTYGYPQQFQQPPPQGNDPTQPQGHGSSQAHGYGPPQSQAYGSPQPQAYGAPQPQAYGPPLAQAYGPPPAQAYGPPPAQTYGPPPPQGYAPPPQGYAPPPAQAYGPPPPQGYAPPPPQGYAPPPPQGHGLPSAQANPSIQVKSGAIQSTQPQSTAAAASTQQRQGQQSSKNQTQKSGEVKQAQQQLQQSGQTQPIHAVSEQPQIYAPITTAPIGDAIQSIEHQPVHSQVREIIDEVYKEEVMEKTRKGRISQDDDGWGWEFDRPREDSWGSGERNRQNDYINGPDNNEKWRQPTTQVGDYVEPIADDYYYDSTTAAADYYDSPKDTTPPALETDKFSRVSDDRRHSQQDPLDDLGKGPKVLRELTPEDIQLIVDNLGTLILQNSTMKDWLQNLIELKLIQQLDADTSTISPYMAVGLNPEKCLGPGVCTGFGLPTGTAVCQFPEKADKIDICDKEHKICPGKNVCPGKEVCPACKDDILHHLRVPGDKARLTALEESTTGLTSSQENLLRQMTAMTLLPRDLEELRQKIKERGLLPDIFDESDVLEKLQTLWEAINILKNNEENMAVRLIQQDTILKRLPAQAIEKLERLSRTSLDELDKLEQDSKRLTKSRRELAEEDIQLIFNNLSSLVLETAAIKERLQGLNDAVLDFDQKMVTKPMLMNVMNDKADKGQMNTKVSYDEFGVGMDELQGRLGNLLQEVYRKNELWKDITDQIREELTEKLDKIEIGPLRAYFKNHLGKLEERVNHLTRIMEEPDPAGTRKKFLKDYNCISCDRHTNISGVTNGPVLPVLGPINAGHTTASQRAYELHRMRPTNSRYDTEGRNLCQIEKQGRGDGSFGAQMPLSEADAFHLVNRYVGGSHTCITMQDRLAALHKRASMVNDIGPKRVSTTGQDGTHLPQDNVNMPSQVVPPPPSVLSQEEEEEEEPKQHIAQHYYLNNE